MTPTNQLTRKKWSFGDWLVNTLASLDNPTRTGMFVRKVSKRGLVNKGTWIELTDGKGKFWFASPESLLRLEDDENRK